MPLGESVAQLYVKLGLDTKDVEKGAKKAETVFDDLGRRLAGVLSIGALVQFGRTAVKAFGDSERAAAKVEAGLTSMGRQGTMSLESLQEEAVRLSRTSIFDDDDILENVTATLVTFGNVGGDAFRRAQEAAIDLANQFGGLKESTVQIGKALEDPVRGVTALARVGVSFSEEQKAMIAAMVETNDLAGAQDIILQSLEKQVGGLAEAVAATSGGQIAQFNNALGNITEVAGGVIAEVLIPFVGLLADLANGFLDLDESAQKMIAGLALTGTGVAALALAFGGWGAVIGGVVALGVLMASNWDEIIWGIRQSWGDLIADTLEGIASMMGSIAGLSSVIPGLGSITQTAYGAMLVAAQNARAAVHDLYIEQYNSRQEAGTTESALNTLNARIDQSAAAAAAAAASIRDMGNAAAEQPERIAPWIGKLEDVRTMGLEPLVTTSLTIPTTLEGVTSELASSTLPAMENVVSASTTRMRGFFGEIGAALRDDLSNILTGTVGPALDGLIPGFARIRGFFDELPALSMAINTAISELMGSLIDYLGQVVTKMSGIQDQTDGITGSAGAAGGAGGTGLLGALAVAASIAAIVFTAVDMLTALANPDRGEGTDQTGGRLPGGGVLPGGPGVGGTGYGFGLDPNYDQWLADYLAWLEATGGSVPGSGYVPPETGNPNPFGRVVGDQPMAQQINVYLDGRMIGQAAVENMPEILDVYGLA